MDVWKGVHRIALPSVLKAKQRKKEEKVSLPHRSTRDSSSMSMESSPDFIMHLSSTVALSLKNA